MVKTGYVRQHNTSRRGKPLTLKQEQICSQTKIRLQEELGNALGLPANQVEAYINGYLTALPD